MPNKHRLSVKLEETTLGNGVWDKVTVKIPNSSYMLTEVKQENNKLSILFCYTNGISYNPMDFSFMLSAFNINPNDVDETHDFLVVGIEDSASKPEKQAAVQSIPNWLNINGYKDGFILPVQENAQKIDKFRCPDHCPPGYGSN